MLTIKEAKAIPSGKGVYVKSKNNSYRALVLRNNKDEILLATENFARSNPKYVNYGKTWSIDKVA